jgi:uncharacterized Tic20 family protein
MSNNFRKKSRNQNMTNIKIFKHFFINSTIQGLPSIASFVQTLMGAYRKHMGRTYKYSIEFRAKHDSNI